jgi:hypothetical protein
MSTPSIAIIPSGFKAGKVYSVLPLIGAADLDFTRASSATRVNKDGIIETVATGVPRLDYSDGGCPSLLLEPQQTQLYELTEAMATQTKTVTAVQHTVGFYGTGTLNFTGAFVGSLVGTGVNDRVELTFTPTAGSLISTVSGTVTKSQLVTGIYLGSYIPNATTGQITRLQDAASKTGLSSYINSNEGVFYAEISSLFNAVYQRQISLTDGTANNRVSIDFDASNRAVVYVVTNSAFQVVLTSTVNQNEFLKVAIKYAENNTSLFINGIKIIEDLLCSMPLGLNTLVFNRGNGSQLFEGKVKDLRVYTTTLTDAELITLTTL